jgi:hypothetical protein
VTALIERFRRETIDDDAVLEGPFGPRRMVYADATASGRSLAFVEELIRRAGADDVRQHPHRGVGHGPSHVGAARGGPADRPPCGRRRRGRRGRVLRLGGDGRDRQAGAAADAGPWAAAGGVRRPVPLRPRHRAHRSRCSPAARRIIRAASPADPFTEPPWSSDFERVRWSRSAARLGEPPPDQVSRRPGAAVARARLRGSDARRGRGPRRWRGRASLRGGGARRRGWQCRRR